MRKFLIRWWYTPNWEQIARMRMILRWNGVEPTWTEEEYQRMLIGERVEIGVPELEKMA